MSGGLGAHAAGPELLTLLAAGSDVALVLVGLAIGTVLGYGLLALVEWHGRARRWRAYQQRPQEERTYRALVQAGWSYAEIAQHFDTEREDVQRAVYRTREGMRHA